MTDINSRGVSRIVAVIVALLALFAEGAATGALAGDNKGNTLVKVLGTVVTPQSDLKNSGDGVLHVSTTEIPTLSIAYFLTDNIAIETICCATEHSISSRTQGLFGLGAGATIADAWIVPLTLSLQYHLPMGAFKPYVGVGVSYYAFFGETSSTPLGDIELKNDWGVTLGGGLDIAVGGGWQLSVDVKKTLNMDSKIYYGGTYVDTAELDPWIISLGVGYRFNASDLFAH